MGRSCSFSRCPGVIYRVISLQLGRYRQARRRLSPRRFLLASRRSRAPRPTAWLFASRKCVAASLCDPVMRPSRERHTRAPGARRWRNETLTHTDRPLSPYSLYPPLTATTIKYEIAPAYRGMRRSPNAIGILALTGVQILLNGAQSPSPSP